MELSLGKLYILFSLFLTPLMAQPKKFKICHKSLSQLLGPEKLHWTLTPGKGSSGEVRLIYQASKGQTTWSLEEKNQLLFLSKKGPSKTQFFNFNPKKNPPCHPNFIGEKTREKESNSSFFTDFDLQNHLNKSSRGIIYLWSPHMPYSIGNFYPLQRVSQKLNIPVLILMDPHANKRETAKVIKKFSIPKKFTRKNLSQSLITKGSALHYPNFFFYKEGELRPFQLFGAKGEEAIQEIVNKYL